MQTRDSRRRLRSSTALTRRCRTAHTPCLRFPFAFVPFFVTNQSPSRLLLSSCSHASPLTGCRRPRHGRPVPGAKPASD